jgi:hypothetical protein
MHLRSEGGMNATRRAWDLSVSLERIEAERVPQASSGIRSRRMTSSAHPLGITSAETSKRLRNRKRSKNRKPRDMRCAVPTSQQFQCCTARRTIDMGRPVDLRQRSNSSRKRQASEYGDNCAQSSRKTRRHTLPINVYPNLISGHEVLTLERSRRVLKFSLAKSH